MLLSWLIGIATLAGLVWLGVTLVQRGRTAATDEPERVLKQRYARGELDGETYHRMLEEIRQ